MSTYDNPVAAQDYATTHDTETEVTPEQRDIIEGATKFAEYLVNGYPQTDNGRKMFVETDEKGKVVQLPDLPESIKAEPKLNYYLSGSLATVLVSKADSYTEIDGSELPHIREAGTKKVPENVRKILASFARPIGDLDYVGTDYYKAQQQAVQDSYYRVTEQEYREGRSKYLWKGGGGPNFDEIPEQAKKAFAHADNEDQISIFCDPVETYGAKRLAKINVEGQDYYITRPDSILGYKVLHLLQSYDQKPEKFNNDFHKLHLAMKELYSEEELINVIHQILSDYEEMSRALHQDHERYWDEKTPGRKSQRYEPKIPAFMKKVVEHPDVSPEILQVLKAFESANKEHA